jgi:hypothetical protein
MKDHIRDTNGVRQRLITAVLLRVESEVEAVIPAGLPTGIRGKIRDEVVPNSRFQVNHLTADELLEGQMVLRHVDDAIATAQYLVNRVQARSNSPTPSTEQVCLDCGGTGAFDLWSGETCECCDGAGIVET